MKTLLALAVLAIPAAAAAEQCHWSGGTFSGEEGSLEVNFSVNEACTEMYFESSGSTGIQPTGVRETIALTEDAHGWVGEYKGVTITLGGNGNFVNFIGKGANMRLQVQEDE